MIAQQNQEIKEPYFLCGLDFLFETRKEFLIKEIRRKEALGQDVTELQIDLDEIRMREAGDIS